jgi:hypothetical protein
VSAIQKSDTGARAFLPAYNSACCKIKSNGELGLRNLYTNALDVFENVFPGGVLLAAILIWIPERDIAALFPQKDLTEVVQIALFLFGAYVIGRASGGPAGRFNRWLRFRYVYRKHIVYARLLRMYLYRELRIGTNRQMYSYFKTHFSLESLDYEGLQRLLTVCKLSVVHHSTPLAEHLLWLQRRIQSVVYCHVPFTILALSLTIYALTGRIGFLIPLFLITFCVLWTVLVLRQEKARLVEFREILFAYYFIATPLAPDQADRSSDVLGTLRTR